MSFPTEATGTIDQRRRDAYAELRKKFWDLVGSFGPIMVFFDSSAHTVTLKDTGTDTTRHTYTSTKADDMIYVEFAFRDYVPQDPNDP